MSLKHGNDEAAELLSLQEFEDIKKQMDFSFASCISKDVEMPTFIVDLEGRVTSTRCESCFAKRKLSYDKSASEFKQVTMNFIYLPPGQSPMGVRSVREVSLFFLSLNHVRVTLQTQVIASSPSSQRAYSGRRRRPTRRMSVRVCVSSSDKIGAIKYRILNQHCFSIRSHGNSSVNEWIRLMSENSTTDLQNELSASEAGIRLNQRYYYSLINVEVMPDIVDYLPRDEATVERGFAGTAFSSQSTPMEVVEIL